jgi:hypothetical protein
MTGKQQRDEQADAAKDGADSKWLPSNRYGCRARQCPSERHHPNLRSEVDERLPARRAHA